MALLSPGVEVTVIDESQTAPPVSTSIPYILLATAQDKVSGTDEGSVAIGTLSVNANVVTPVTSRRELISLYGIPNFQVDVSGTVVQGHELNEYGLQTAYSLLGVTNRVYVQRVDIDMAELIGTSVRPTNTPADGTLWFDIANTDFGLFEWNTTDQTFNKITPIVIDNVNNQSGGVPNSDIGTIGDYAVVVTSASNPVYYKDIAGDWLLVGSDAWIAATPGYQGSIASPTITIGNSFDINNPTTGSGATVTATGTTVASLAADINTAAVPGITASALNDKITFFITALAESDGVTADGGMFFDNPIGTIFTDLGITAGPGIIYWAAEVQLSAHTSVPEWKATDTQPRPSGSVWSKTTPPN